MRRHYQLYILVSVLILIGLGGAVYKYFALGFNFLPGGMETVWQVQAKIAFEPKTEGNPVKISMVLPTPANSRRSLLLESLAADYHYHIDTKEGVSRAVWTRQKVNGKQVIYLRGDFYYQYAEPLLPPQQSEIKQPDLTPVQQDAAKKILQQATQQADSKYDIALHVIAMMNEENHNDDVKLLLENIRYRSDQMNQVRKVLALANISSRVIRGLRLQDGLTQRSITTFIKIFDNNQWTLIDPRDLTEVPTNQVLLWPEGTRGVVDVYGGKNSSIHFSILKQQKKVDYLAIDSARVSNNPLVNFSIYSLPTHAQNTFKILLLIPLGALVVVILRNLVGIRTSGTFMPILIALTFMQTTLLLGLLLFLVVVSVGLIMRSYLSHLNLLLVPRIASVLVFVIIIFAAIGILSHKMGWESGLNVTYFPMIILSWTIERMSVLWEEEGPHEVLIQGGGSLLTASLAYLVMINPYVGHITFNFPELLLVLLAIIIMIGSYSGFRLLELARFEPMTRLNRKD